MNGTEKKGSSGWDLSSAASIPVMCRHGRIAVKVCLVDRATGEKESAVVSRRSPYLAIREAVRQIAGIFPDDEPQCYDSLYGFAFAAVVGVNISIHKAAEVAAKESIVVAGQSEVLELLHT